MDHNAITESAPTLMSDQTLAYSEELPELYPEESNWRRTILIAIAILGVMGGIAGAVAIMGRSAPTDPVAEAFKQSAQDVPISDWDYAMVQAREVCPAPPAVAGDYAVNQARGKVASSHPDWTEGQVYRFTAAAFKTFCPNMLPPSREKLDAMTKDERFAALLGSRLGLTTPDKSMSDAAVQICKDLSGGYPYDNIVTEVLDSNKHIKNWTREDATQWVDTATEVYCPLG